VLKPVTVIVPVYNEEKTLGEILERIFISNEVDKIEIVDDGSTDNSLKIAKGMSKKAAKYGKEVVVIHKNKNEGKGAALQRGLSTIKKGTVIIQDADLEYFPEDYPKLLSALAQGEVVFGNRFAGRNEGHRYILADLGNRFVSFVFDLLFSQKIHDINVGLKAFKISALKNTKLKEKGFLIEEELSVTFANKGIKILEVPIRYKGRTFKQGKKIKMKDGINGLVYILKRRFIA